MRIKNPIDNMNQIESEKYDCVPNYIEKKSLSSQKFRITFNFEWIKKSKVAKRLDKLSKKLYEHKKRKLRESLDLGEKVLLVSEKIKKKSATR